MSQPRYSEELKRFIKQWRPNDPELDQRFMADIRSLISAIVSPPTKSFDVSTILTHDGGLVVVSLGDYEAQLSPVQAHHLALSLIEAAASARIETWLSRFMIDKTQMPEEITLGMIAQFRNYRIVEMEKELAGDLAKQGTIPKDGK